MRNRLISVLLCLVLFISLFAGLTMQAAAEQALTDEQIIEAAVVYLNIKEGNCDSVNANDNGAVSIGMIQWHGCRALKLLNRILKKYLETHTADDAIALLGNALYAEISSASSSGAEWDKRIMTADEKALLVKFLGTDESKQIQGLQAREDLSGYLTRGRVRGMVTPAMLFYYIDMENQYGAGGAYNLLTHAKEVTGLDSFVCLGELHNGLVNTAYWARRKSTYNYVTNTLGWEAPYFVCFDGGGAEGTPTRGTPVARGAVFTVAQNTFEKTGFAFTGWNVRRESDGAWYIAGIGWCSPGWIETKGYTKCLYSAGQLQTADEKFLSSAGSYNAFTFVAVWKANGVLLEFYNNTSSGNYLLGSDLSEKLNTDYVAASSAYTLKLDTQTRMHGDNSMLITASAAGTAGDGVNFLTSTHGSADEDGFYPENKKMTLSFWAKGDTGGEKLNLCWKGQAAPQKVTLTQQWAQYTVDMSQSEHYGSNLIVYPDAAGTFRLAQLSLTDGEVAGAFRAENGGKNATLAAGYSEAYGELPTAKLDGYTFLGWFTSASGGTQILPTSIVEKGTRRLYAHWEKHWNCNSNGHEWQWQSDVLSTCTVGGYSTFRCIDCGQTKQGETLLPLGHAYKDTVTQEATCTTDGATTRTCTRCGITDTVCRLPATGHHASEPQVITEATCTKGGSQTVTCTVCRQTIATQSTPALGHSWGDWVTFTQASDTMDGSRTRTCTRCGQLDVQKIPADKHKHTFKTTEVAATCTTAGYTSNVCDCGYEQITETAAALGHSWGEPVILKPATALQEGTAMDICTRCGVAEYRTLELLGTQEVAAFRDMPAQGSWSYEGIRFALGAKLFKGVSETKFSPGSSMTRAMLVTVLYRLAGEPDVGNSTCAFADVGANTWYTNGVIWAADKEIVNGISETRFAPDSKVTREQLAAILYRYALYKGYDITKRAPKLSSFADYKKVSDYALDALSWANAQEIIKGTDVQGTNYLNPQGNATRAEVATMLLRFAKNLIP